MILAFIVAIVFGEFYRGMGWLTRYFVKRLTRLGHRVILEPCSAAA